MKFDTSVDLVDFMLLLQMRIDASQYLLKGLLLGTAVLYLFGVVWFYRRTRRTMEVVPPSQVLVQEGIQIPPGN
jgi:Na+/H+-translocating membrane pyrophosphatase